MTRKRGSKKPYDTLRNGDRRYSIPGEPGVFIVKSGESFGKWYCSCSTEVPTHLTHDGRFYLRCVRWGQISACKMNCRVDDLKRREQETFRLDPKHLSESEHWRRSAHPGYDSWAKDKERKRARSLQSRARSEPAVNGSKRRAGEDLTSSSTKRQRPDEVTESKPENNTTRASDNVSRVMGDAAKAAWQRRWRQLEMDKKAQEAFRHAAEQKILAMNRKAQEALQRKLAADQEATEAWENKKKAEKDLERANEQHHAAIEKRERAADDEVEALQEKINAEEEEVQARNKSSAIFHQLVALMRDSRDPGGGWF